MNAGERHFRFILRTSRGDGFPNEKLQKKMDGDTKRKCRDEEIRRKEREEFLGEVTGNQRGPEVARQRERVSRG